MMRRTLQVFVGTLVVVMVLGWFGGSHPWLELLTNAPTQLLALGVVGAGVAALRRQWIVLAFAAVVVAWFAIQLWPYVRATPDPRPVDPAAVHIAQQYNVYFGNDDLDRITAEVQASDAAVVALHEITTDQWVGLLDRLPQYPHSIAEPWDGGDLQLGGGMAILSRTPLDPIEVDGAADVVGRPILAASTSLGDHDVVVIGLHPHASRFEKQKVDLRAAQLDAVVKLLAVEQRPTLILTDLNMTPTSADYRAFLDRLDWDDPHVRTGWDASWPTQGAAFGLPIDHVLVSEQIALHDITTGGGGGSDHRSLTAEFSIRE